MIGSGHGRPGAGACLLGISVYFVACGAEPVPPADLVITGGSVYSLDWGDPGPDGTPAPDAPYDVNDGWRPGRIGRCRGG